MTGAEDIAGDRPDRSNDVVDDTGSHRFRYRESGQEATLIYRQSPGRLTLVHTGVPEALGGRGIGGRLVQAAVERAARSGEVIAPGCPYARAWLTKHQEEAARVTIDWPEPPTPE